MMSLAVVVDRFDTSIKPIVDKNKMTLEMNSMIIGTNSDNIATNSADIATASSGIGMSSAALAIAQNSASLLPDLTPSWKEQIQSLNLAGTAMGAPTALETDPRQDYIDSIDVIFPMHQEYMPIIKEFRCFEDENGRISGYEVEYMIMPVLDTRFLSSREWKTVGRRGTNAEVTDRTLMVRSDDYISKVSATVGEGIEQMVVTTSMGMSLTCGLSNPVGTEQSAEGYIVSFDTHFRNTLVGLDVKYTTTAVGDEANSQTQPFR